MTDSLTPPPEAPEGVSSFIPHLIELRTRLLRCVVAVILVFLGLFHWSQDLYHFLALPLLEALPAGGQMIATDVTTPFFVPVKVTLMTAFLITLPFVLYQIWAFIAPGLYAHEKRFIVPLVFASLVLFLTGMAFAYFLVFPIIFHFMTTIAPEGVAVMTDIERYLSFVLGMFLAFGVTFEVPIVVIVLAKVGIVSLEQLKAARSYVIVGAFVVAAVVTPPDVLSQIMMAVPLWLLYEVGVLMVRWMQPKMSVEGDNP